MNKHWYHVFDIHAACKRKGVKQCTYDVFQQMKYQYYQMASSKFRRPSILHLYESTVSTVNNTLINKNCTSLIQHIDVVKENIDKEIELLIHDGKKWNEIPIQYRESFNNIFHIAYYNLFVLDLLKEKLLLEEGEEENNYLQIQPIDPNLLIQDVIYDLKGLSIEKFGVMPEITIRNSKVDNTSTGDHELQGVKPYIHFSFVEIIKNNIQAVIDQYGELEIDNLDDAPIVIDIVYTNQNDSIVDIYFHDLGVGVLNDDLNPFDALSTSREVVNAEPTYTYSRDFGVQFSGKGIGLLKTKMYLEMHHGNIELYSPTNLELEYCQNVTTDDNVKHGKGTTTKVSFLK